MNYKEILMPWRPLEGLNSKVRINSVSYDYDGLDIVLVENDHTKRKLRLHCRARAWRESGGLLAKNYLKKHTELYKNEELYSGSLFTLTNSEYLKWAAGQTGLSVEDLGDLRIFHYCIITEDKILDILSWGNPKAEFIDVV